MLSPKGAFLRANGETSTEAKCLLFIYFLFVFFLEDAIAFATTVHSCPILLSPLRVNDRDKKQFRGAMAPEIEPADTADGDMNL